MALTGKGLVTFAKGKKGTPYFYGSKIQNGVLTEDYMKTMNKYYPNTVTTAYMQKARTRKQVGKVNVDCSGLIYGYTGKNLGSSQLYSQAYTRLAVNTYKDWADGVVTWRSGHVGIFFKENGKYYVAEAKGIDYGTVISEFKPEKWSYGLTFSWINYDYIQNIVKEATWKGTNPYTEPTRTLKRGHKADDVKWVQWELREAGFNQPFTYEGKEYKAVTEDGSFGAITEAAVCKFQQSCKIAVDGVVGATTRKMLKNK